METSRAPRLESLTKHTGGSQHAGEGLNCKQQLVQLTRELHKLDV